MNVDRKFAVHNLIFISYITIPLKEKSKIIVHKSYASSDCRTSGTCNNESQLSAYIIYILTAKWSSNTKHELGTDRIHILF